MGTVITDWGGPEITERLLENFPEQWSSEEARQPGGVAYALFAGLAEPHDQLCKNILYTFNACRIATATDAALDAIGQDYFGGELQRYRNESDELYRQRILIHLLLEKGTIAGIKRAIELATGFTPVIREPWNRKTFPVAYYNLKNAYGGYWNRSKLFAPSLRYQMFIDARLPAFQSDNKPQPIYGFGSAAFNVPNCAWFKPRGIWSRGHRELDKVINAAKPVGTIAWRRYYRNEIPELFSS